MPTQQVKEHLYAIGEIASAHVDMLWQEEYFDMWDEHLTPLIEECGEDGAGVFKAEDAKKYAEMVRLAYANAWCWFQEDWYEFCDNLFELLLSMAQRDGEVEALIEKFPYIYSVCE